MNYSKNIYNANANCYSFRLTDLLIAAYCSSLIKCLNHSYYSLLDLVCLFEFVPVPDQAMNKLRN